MSRGIRLLFGLNTEIQRNKIISLLMVFTLMGIYVRIAVNSAINLLVKQRK